MQTKVDPTSYIHMTSMGKNSQKATDNRTLPSAVKFQYGSKYHTDKSQKLSKHKVYLTRNLATKSSNAKHGHDSQQEST